MPVEQTVSPRVLAKMVYAGTSANAFQAASEDLSALAHLSISAERIRRACLQVGVERIEHHQRMEQAFQEKPLPRQLRDKPDDVQPPEIACVMCDGGRYQLLDRRLPPKPKTSARKGEHWKESRIGLLADMRGPSHACDPRPTLPAELRYEAMAEKLSEIGRTGRRSDVPEENGEHQQVRERSEPSRQGFPGPDLERRHVVASRQSWQDFGRLLASQAWYHGFAAAPRKAFVSDGSSALEELHRTHFSHYTSILDLLHALSYSLAAARAVTPTEAQARDAYNHWAAKIWEGNVRQVIDELAVHANRLGPPPDNPRSDDPREVVRTSRVYYQNHATRMDYPRYRREGLPLTSSLMESTVKQVGRRVKGTEKFWSRPGGEAMLRLRAESLSDDRPLVRHLETRSRRTTGTRSYRPKPLYA